MDTISWLSPWKSECASAAMTQNNGTQRILTVENVVLHYTASEQLHLNSCSMITVKFYHRVLTMENTGCSGVQRGRLWSKYLSADLLYDPFS